MPISLNQEQIQQAVEIMQAYLAAPPTAEGCMPVDSDMDPDRQRASIIESELNPPASSYLPGQTNEVCLVEADALVAMADAKMRSPNDVSLGPGGLQRHFSLSGVLSAEVIRGTLV